MHHNLSFHQLLTKFIFSGKVFIRPCNHPTSLWKYQGKPEMWWILVLECYGCGTTTMMKALLYPKAKQGTRRQTEPLHAVHGSLGQITACVANAKHFNDTWKFTGKKNFSCWPIFRIAWVRRIEGHMVTSRPSHHYTIHSPHHAATTPSMASTSSPSSSLSVQLQSHRPDPRDTWVR